MSIAGNLALVRERIAKAARSAGRDPGEVRLVAVSKLHPLVASERMRGILGAGPNAVDVGRLIDDRGILLVDLASPTLGVPASKMLGALWLMQHWVAMGRRRDTSTPHVIICDEAHLFQYGALPSLLAEGRKFGIGVVVATQDSSRLRSTLTEALESNAGSFISLRSSARSASASASRLEGWSADSLMRLPDLTAAATISRGGVMTEPFTLQLDHYRRLARSGPSVVEQEQNLAEIRRRSAALYSDPFRDSVPPSDAELVRMLTEKQQPKAPERQQTAFLEDWLAARTTVRQNPSKSDIEEDSSYDGITTAAGGSGHSPD